MKISFEFFPPRTVQGRKNLVKVRQQLRELNPDYFSVTFGAGGTIQNATLETVLDIERNDGVPAAPHLSCINSEKDKIDALLEQYKNAGIRRLIVLRGDIPSGVRDIGDFHYANELVAFIRTKHHDDFRIEVAAYPEMHPQSKNITLDLTHFANKIKAGADGAITQYFYNADGYFRFVDEVRKLGVEVPITPGIMPITNTTQLINFSRLCGAEIPKWILERLKRYENDLTALADFGFDVVLSLCQTLQNQGVNDFHFYSMNKAQPSLRLAKALIDKG